MTEGAPLNHENEGSLGLSTLEIAQRVVGSHPEIQTVHLRPYFYIPNRPSDASEVSHPFPRDRFLDETQNDIDHWAVTLGEGFNIALDSRVILNDGTQGHFVMADLGPCKSDENLEKIKLQFNNVIVPFFWRRIFP
jgi:hypothetical protein